MSKTDPALPEEKSTSKFPLGLTSTLLGFFLLVSSCGLYYVPAIFAGPDGNLRNSGVQEAGYFLLFYYFCAAGLAIAGIFLGIISIREKTVLSWLGIVLNLIALCVIPVIWVLMLTVLATA